MLYGLLSSSKLLKITLFASYDRSVVLFYILNLLYLMRIGENKF